MVAARRKPERHDPRMVRGLQKDRVGGKAKFYIPPSLAYGDSGNQGIPRAPPSSSRSRSWV